MKKGEMKEVLKYMLKFVAALICLSPFFIILFGPPIIAYYLAIPDHFWTAAVASIIWIAPAMFILEKISKYLDKAAWYLLEKIHDI
ncbi:MAG: hypothetical protein ACXAC5_05490 [Promethearchaeota archaeon]|jgi:hypothetical protein